jgi:hypothetical protein
LSATLRFFLPFSHYLIGRKDMKNVILLLALAESHVIARSISYMGTLDLVDANSLALFSFTLATSGTLNIQTWGYGGGTNAAGTVIANGGFDPYVSLFAGTGDLATFAASNDDGLCPPGNGSIACQDSTLNLANLTAGSYTLALTVFENMSFAENSGSGSLGDGFVGLGSYDDSTSNSTRTPNYAIDIKSSALVPEPSTLALTASAELEALLRRWSRVRRRTS